MSERRDIPGPSKKKEKPSEKLPCPSTSPFLCKDYCFSRILTPYDVMPTNPELYIDACQGISLYESPETKFFLVYDEDKSKSYNMFFSHTVTWEFIRYSISADWETFVTDHNLKAGDEISFYRYVDKNVCNGYFYILKFAKKPSGSKDDDVAENSEKASDDVTEDKRKKKKENPSEKWPCPNLSPFLCKDYCFSRILTPYDVMPTNPELYIDACQGISLFDSPETKFFLVYDEDKSKSYNMLFSHYVTWEFIRYSISADWETFVTDHNLKAVDEISFYSPLSDGLTDDDLRSLFHPIIDKVMQVYAVALHFSADSFGKCNLSVKGHADAFRFLRSFNVPLMLLDGGGCKIRNVDRCCCYETAVAVDVEPDYKLPHTKYFGPDYTLHEVVLANNPPTISASLTARRCMRHYKPYYLIFSPREAHHSLIFDPLTQGSQSINLHPGNFRVIGKFTPKVQPPNWFLLLHQREVLFFNVGTRVRIQLPELPHTPLRNSIATFWGNPDEQVKVLIIELGRNELRCTPFYSTRGWGGTILFAINEFDHAPQGEITLSRGFSWVNVRSGLMYSFGNLWQNFFDLRPPTISLLGNGVARLVDCICSFIDIDDVCMLIWRDEEPHLYGLYKLGNLVQIDEEPYPRYEMLEFELQDWETIFASPDGPGILTTIGPYIASYKKVYLCTSWLEECLEIDGMEDPKIMKRCYSDYYGPCFCIGYIVIL